MSSLGHQEIVLNGHCPEINWVTGKPTLTTGSIRCRPVSNFSAASVSNTDGMPPIERQLYGTSTVKIFLPPES
jgi:hypothetical protein